MPRGIAGASLPPVQITSTGSISLVSSPRLAYVAAILGGAVARRVPLPPRHGRSSGEWLSCAGYFI
jgi:hypothetical protein